MSSCINSRVHVWVVGVLMCFDAGTQRDASMLAGAIVVQKLWRGLAARRRYQRVRKAVLRLQRFARTVVWARRYERCVHQEA